MKTYFLLPIIIFLSLQTIAQVTMGDYNDPGKITRANKPYPHKNGLFTIDYYPDYGKKHKLGFSSNVEKMGISDYNKDLSLNFRTIFPKKVNKKFAHFNNCFNVNGKYYLFVETVEENKGGEMVILYGLTYDEKAQEWSKPIYLEEREGGFLSRRNSSRKISYNEELNKFQSITDLYSKTDNLIFTEFDTDFKGLISNEILALAPNSILYNSYSTKDSYYFLYKEIKKNYIIQFGQTGRKSEVYWISEVNKKDLSVKKFTFNPGLYQIEKGKFTQNGDKISFYADVYSTEESKKTYHERDYKIGWYVADITDMLSPDTILVKSRDFFGKPKEKSTPMLLATFLYFNSSSELIEIDNLIPVKDGYLIFIEKAFKQYSSSKGSTYHDYSVYKDIVIIKVNKNFEIENEQTIKKRQYNDGKLWYEISYSLLLDSNKIRLYYNDNKANFRLPADSETTFTFSIYDLEDGVFREVIITEDGNIGPDRELFTMSKKDAIVPRVSNIPANLSDKIYFIASQKLKRHPNKGQLKVVEVVK